MVRGMLIDVEHQPLVGRGVLMYTDCPLPWCEYPYGGLFQTANPGFANPQPHSFWRRAHRPDMVTPTCL